MVYMEAGCVLLMLAVRSIRLTRRHGGREQSRSSDQLYELDSPLGAVAISKING
jgi:hypothetical protein